MDNALMGYFMVAALVIPIAFYSIVLFFMAMHPITGRHGEVRDEIFESSYQPMRILVARTARLVEEQKPAEAPEVALPTRAAA